MWALAHRLIQVISFGHVLGWALIEESSSNECVQTASFICLARCSEPPQLSYGNTGIDLSPSPAPKTTLYATCYFPFPASSQLSSIKKGLDQSTLSQRLLPAIEATFDIVLYVCMNELRADFPFSSFVRQRGEREPVQVRCVRLPQF